MIWSLKKKFVAAMIVTCLIVLLSFVYCMATAVMHLWYFNHKKPLNLIVFSTV